MPRLLVAIIVGLLIVPTADHAAENDTLVVAPYPDSVPFAHLDGHATIASDQRLRDQRRLLKPDIQAYYSSDPIAKVKAYYERALGEIRNDYLAGRSLGGRADNWPFVYSHSVDPERQLGIELHALDPAQHAAGSDDSFTSVGPFFRTMLGLTDTCNTELAYAMAAIDYRHLATSFFQLTDHRSSDGRGYLTVDQVILARCRKEHDVQAYKHTPNRRSTPKSSPPDAMDVGGGAEDDAIWQGWMDCLAELDKQDFKTLIIIDKR